MSYQLISVLKRKKNLNAGNVVFVTTFGRIYNQQIE